MFPPTFDRTGFQLDINMVLPLDRLKELAELGSYRLGGRVSLLLHGGHRPHSMETEARNLAGLLKHDRVNCVLLVPV